MRERGRVGGKGKGWRRVGEREIRRMKRGRGREEVKVRGKWEVGGETGNGKESGGEGGGRGK